MRLGEAPVKPDKLQREAYLILKSETHGVAGSGGCNRLNGGYELDASRLIFTRVATTRMACTNGMETEKDFLASLGKVRAWAIDGQDLKLLDGDGNALATLEAEAPPQ
jgi:heat shock protein HslJ